MHVQRWLTSCPAHLVQFLGLGLESAHVQLHLLVVLLQLLHPANRCDLGDLGPKPKITLDPHIRLQFDKLDLVSSAVPRLPLGLSI